MLWVRACHVVLGEFRRLGNVLTWFFGEGQLDLKSSKQGSAGVSLELANLFFSWMGSLPCTGCRPRKLSSSSRD